MSVSLATVISAGGYDLATVKDAKWFLSKKSEFAELVEFAENVIEEDAQKTSHNRFDEAHRNICDDCRRDYEDFRIEQDDDARLDEMSESEES